MKPQPVKVVYIVAWGRSGSTVLDLSLGQLDGFLSAGEVRHLFGAWPNERHPCGCGRSLQRCELWSAVGEALEIGDPDELDRRWKSIIRLRKVPELLRRESRRSTGSAELDRIIRVVSQIYERAVDRAGARVLVDSSKAPGGAALLRLLPGVSPYIVHLIRDPRAVAFSWQRPTMKPRSIWNSTVRWLATNAAARMVARRYPPGRAIVVRYEDLVARPRDVLTRIVAMLDGEPMQLPASVDHEVDMAGNHTVWGNPIRTKKGPLQIRSDDEWMTRQSPSHRRFATLIALPLLRTYGYPLVPKAGR